MTTSDWTVLTIILWVTIGTMLMPVVQMLTESRITVSDFIHDMIAGAIIGPVSIFMLIDSILEDLLSNSKFNFVLFRAIGRYKDREASASAYPLNRGKPARPSGQALGGSFNKPSP